MYEGARNPYASWDSLPLCSVRIRSFLTERVFPLQR